MGKQWSGADIPDLTGKHIIVTGGNRGLGYASVVEFAQKGAHVVIASRSIEKGDAAIAEIKKAVPNLAGSLETMELDCLSFASVRAFADAYTKKHGHKLDVLLNNAGMATSIDYKRVETVDGHEEVWQANVWSACLLSALLLPALAHGATPAAPGRIVFVSSLTATMDSVSINIDDPESVNGMPQDKEENKDKWWTYPNTKCADWMISNALSKRFSDAGDERLKGRVLATCAHPGFSSTDMTAGFGAVANFLLGMPARQGCLSQVRVAVDPTVPSGAYYGPTTSTWLSMQHFFLLGNEAAKMSREPELYGSPVPSSMVSPFAGDAALCEQLLQKAEEVIGTKFDLP